MSEIILSTTNVGSHMWKMNHENSDTDLFTIYVADTKEYLMGIANLDSTSKSNGLTGKDKVEEVRHEIGHVIEQLLTGNVNFLWGVLSPIIIYPKQTFDAFAQHPEDLEPFQTLRDIVKDNLAKNSYNSIHGLAIANKRKYLDSVGCPEDVKKKKVKIILRTLNFGINILRGNGSLFDKIADDLDIQIVEPWIQELENVYRDSQLPESPNPEPFRQYLFDLRMRNL